MINMNTPIGQTPLDTKPGLVGQGVDRIDGPLKVTGHATYAAEYRDMGQPLYGYLVLSTIPKGKLDGIDTDLAERMPGVRLVITYKNAPKQGPRTQTGNPQLSSPAVDYMGQPIALVVAESFEQARAAAYQVAPRYAAEHGTFDMGSNLAAAFTPKANNNPPDTETGNFESGFAAAPVKIDAQYTTPPQSHAMMEPHGTIAVWKGDAVTFYTANQMLPRGTGMIADTLQIPKEKIRMVSRYVGGGFGAKLQVEADAILAALAAKMAGAPVKVVLTRQQVFPVTKHRTDTIQRVRLGAQPDGTMVAIGHQSWSNNTPGDQFYETAAHATRSFYAGPNRMTAHRLVALDLPHSASMRAPGEAVGLLALECAMDELAVALDMDPIALRVKNEPTEDPEKQGRPFSTRTFVPCMQHGAEMFGWSKRVAKPGQVRDGNWLVGMGMSGAIRGNPMLPAKANIMIDGKGVATVRTSMTDIGTGPYTILAQIAGDMLGMTLDRVRVELGDTDLPPAPGSGGSFGANSAGAAVFDACENMRRKLLQTANLPEDGARFADNHIAAGGKTLDLAEIATMAGPSGIAADGAADPGDSRKKFNQESYGAFFAEVGVDIDTGEIRLRRMLGVFTAGRILNPKTARSQAIGGMTMGIGAALMEDVIIDKRDGFMVNANLAEYHVPVHADVPAIDAVFLPELDDKSSPMKSKGVGELGICGAGASLANAVYNATGVRIRDYPLTLDKVLKGWSQAS